jgi:hypothetical protein
MRGNGLQERRQDSYGKSNVHGKTERDRSIFSENIEIYPSIGFSMNIEFINRSKGKQVYEIHYVSQIGVY